MNHWSKVTHTHTHTYIYKYLKICTYNPDVYMYMGANRPPVLHKYAHICGNGHNYAHIHRSRHCHFGKKPSLK